MSVVGNLLSIYLPFRIANNGKGMGMGRMMIQLLMGYSTQSHFTADDVNSKVLDLGSVFGTLWFNEVRGNVLQTSLIAKVGTGSSSVRNSEVALDSFVIDSNTGMLPTTTNHIGLVHPDLGLVISGDSPAVKTLDYLSSENGVAKLMYVYKEMVYDSGKDNDNIVNVTYSGPDSEYGQVIQ